MSIHVLVTGILHKDAVSRVSQNGNNYATCTVRVEHDGQTVWANVICFDEVAQAELLRLSAGDAVSIHGKGMPKVYMKDDEARPSLQVTATGVLALQPKYDPPPKSVAQQAPSRAKPKPKPAPKTSASRVQRSEEKHTEEGFDDPLDF
jgi:single-stranded DNA-binding protein